MPRPCSVLLASLLLMLSGCAARPTTAEAATPAAASVAAPSTLTADRLGFWRAVHADGDRVPAGQRPEDLLPELETMLGAIDPAIRDDLAYNVLEAWIVRVRLLDREAVRGVEAGSAEGRGVERRRARRVRHREGRVHEHRLHGIRRRLHAKGRLGAFEQERH